MKTQIFLQGYMAKSANSDYKQREQAGVQGVLGSTPDLKTIGASPDISKQTSLNESAGKTDVRWPKVSVDTGNVRLTTAGKAPGSLATSGPPSPVNPRANTAAGSVVNIPPASPAPKPVMAANNPQLPPATTLPVTPRATGGVVSNQLNPMTAKAAFPMRNT